MKMRSLSYNEWMLQPYYDIEETAVEQMISAVSGLVVIAALLGRKTMAYWRAVGLVAVKRDEHHAAITKLTHHDLDLAQSESIDLGSALRFSSGRSVERRV